MVQRADERLFLIVLPDEEAGIDQPANRKNQKRCYELKIVADDWYHLFEI